MACVLGDNEWCSPESPCFECDEAAHRLIHPDMDDPDCVTCRLRSLQVSPAATPTKTRRIGPLGFRGNNSWERGVVRDDRGMPLVKADGSTVGVKEYAENRSRYDEFRRAVRTGHAPKE